MGMSKRILMFIGVNLLIVVTLSTVLSLLGIKPYITAYGLDYSALMVFCLVWGFGGAFISLALSKTISKWMMGVKIIDPNTAAPNEAKLLNKVYQFARSSGIQKMPEVGIYESPELNAFATGPSRNSSLVAVSSGLLLNMNEAEIDGVLAHEVGHIANGDMVTMTLIQGIINSFVMFLARVISFAVSQAVEENKRSIVQFAVTIVMEILLGILGMIVVAAFSRAREFRADASGAQLAGTNSMVAALEKLKLNYDARMPKLEDEPALATLKISGKTPSWLKLFSTHPDLDLRIAKLRGM